MRITDLLSKDGIELNVTAKDKNDIIDKMTKLMLKTGRITDLEAFKKLVLKREEEGSIRTDEIRKERKNLFIKRSNIYEALMKLIKKLPKGYRYRVIDKIEEYAEIIDEENVNPYFVTKYSKVTEKEDRAEIFAEVMILNKKVKFLEEGQNIRKKVDYISEILSECITKEDFYFYRFL